MTLVRQIVGYCLVYCSNNCSINQYLFIQCLHPVLTIVGDAKERHSSVIYTCLAFPAGVSGKKPTCQYRRHRSDPWVEKIPWRRAWQPTPVFLQGESHGQRSLVGCIHGVTKSQTRLRQISMHALLAWSLHSHTEPSCIC